MGLLNHLEVLQRVIKNVYKLDTSIEFLECADAKVTKWFYTKTGFKKSRAISLAFTFVHTLKEDGTSETDEAIIRKNNYYRKEISGIPFSLCIKTNFNPVVLVWWSKSGRIYEPTDTDIDYNDIEFALEPFQWQLYCSQLNYNEPHPFNKSELPFTLQVEGLGVDVTLRVAFRKEQNPDIPEFISKTYAFIEKFNDYSLANGRKFGIVHNSRILQNGDIFTIALDSGSAGVQFFQSLFEMFSGTGFIEKVVMTSP